MTTPRTNEEVFNVIKPFVTDEMFELLKSRVKLGGKGKGKRFARWMKKFALQLHFRGARAYRFLSLFLTLLSERSIRRWLSNVKILPGIIPGIIQSVASPTKSWSKRDRV